MEEEINTVEAKNVPNLENHIRGLEAKKIQFDELMFTQKPLDTDVSDWWIVENTDLGVTYDSVVLRHLIQEEGRGPKFEISLDEGVNMMKDGRGKGKLVKDDPYPF